MKVAAITIALAVCMASPVLAQKGEHGKADKEHGKQKTEIQYKEKTDKRGNTKVEYREQGPGVKKVEMKSKGGAPAFCRNGAGHPVYGRQWCLNKGFGLGSQRWNRVTWGDVVLQPRRATVADVLSSVVLGRLTNYAAQTLGLSAPLNGTWLTNTTDRRVYIVRSGSTPVAEMVDTNHDGRADYILLYAK